MIESINAKRIKELRKLTGAGIMACKRALVNTNNDFQEAIKKLQINGDLIAKKKSDKSVNEGVIEAYIHTGNRLGILIELNCETDFVSKKLEFKELAKNIAMQIASCPEVKVISKEDILVDTINVDTKSLILLEQNYVKDPSITISQLLKKYIALFGENIKITRFIRYKLSE